MATLRETTMADAPLQVDRENGVIRGVKLLGRESKNTLRSLGVDRKTFAGVLDQPYSYGGDCSKKYDGIAFNLNHYYDDRDRPVQECVGEVRNPTFRDDGHYGEVHLILSHPMSEFVMEAAENFPKRFGCSHEAKGEPRVKGGKAIIEDWEPVSVDLVSRPATTNGMFESKRHKMKTLREVIKNSKDKDLVKLLKEMETSGMIDPGMDAPMADPPAEGDELKPALMSMLMARLESASTDEVKKMLKVLGIEDSISAAIGGDGDAPDPAPEPELPSDDTGDEPMESIKQENAALKAKNSLLESNRKATPERVEALTAVKPETARLLIESWPEDLRPVADPKIPLRSMISYGPLSRATDPVSKMDAKFQEILARR